MLRIVFLLIAIFEIALVQSQSNGTAVIVGEIPNNSTTNSTTIEPVSPNITTSSPTTTKPTTVSPTTASTPTPTVPPTQSPVIWTGNVTKDTNNTCINVKFMAQITIKYNTSNTTEMTTAFNIPANASVNEDKSYCSDEKKHATEVIFISFVDEEYTSADLMLTFNKSNGNVFVEEIELTFNLTKALFPGYFDPTQYDKMMKVTKNDLKLFSVGNSHSYLCNDAQTASLEDKNKGLETEIRFTNSQVEAYIDINRKGEFDSEINCKTTEINDVVPIAVGAALAGLVVIVLIAYFIGRRRSRRLAYQSV